MKMRVDLSARGITTRLKRVSQLRRLCLLLGKAELAKNKLTHLSRTDKDKEQKGNIKKRP
jgi:hypothetical protein